MKQEKQQVKKQGPTGSEQTSGVPQDMTAEVPQTDSVEQLLDVALSQIGTNIQNLDREKVRRYPSRFCGC